MKSFIAHVEIRFDSDTVKCAGERLDKLTKIARTERFYVTSARIEPAPPADDPQGRGWVQYAPSR